MRSRTTTTTTWCGRMCAMAAWPAYRPAPRVPSTTGARCRWAGPTALKSSSAGKNCPASLRPTNWLQQAQNPLQRQQQHNKPLGPLQSLARRCFGLPSTEPRCRLGPPRMRTPICFRPKTRPQPPWSATSPAPRRVLRAKPTMWCSTSAACRSLCWKGNRLASSRRASMRLANRTTRANTRWPAHAMVNAPATTIWR